MIGAAAIAGLRGRLDRARLAGRRLCASRPALEHLLRAGERFAQQEGGRQAATVTYFGFLSFFPLVALAFAVVGYLLDWDPGLRSDLTDVIDRALPGLVGSRPGQVNVDQIASARAGAGILGLFGLVWAGTSWVAGLRTALRSMWRNERKSERNIIVRKLRDVVLLGVLGVAALFSVALSTVATIATGGVVDALGFAGGGVASWLIRVSAVLIAMAGSTVLFAATFWSLCGRHVPGRALWRGAALAAVGFEALKLSASLLLGHTVRNPVYATFSVAVGLLVWINFVSRLTLFAAAWTATATLPRSQPASAVGAEPAVAAAHP